MGICQIERADIEHMISKERTYRTIPLKKVNRYKLFQPQNNYNSTSHLDSISLNNIQFNNSKRNSGSYYKIKKTPSKDSKISLDENFKNISLNNKHYLTRSNITIKCNIKSNKKNPSTLKKIPNSTHFTFAEEKSPSDNNKRKKLKKMKKKENPTNKSTISISPSRNTDSNSISFFNIKNRSINILNEKPQYIEQKIINDDDDTDKILFNLNEEIKKKDNKQKDSLILSFDNKNKEDEDIQLYYLNEFHFNSENTFSTEKDFDGLLQSQIYKNKINFTNLLLLLPERQWYRELIDLSDSIKRNRQKKNIDPTVFDEYLNKFIKIYNHFNHLVWALGYFYSNSLLFNKSAWFKKDKLNLPVHNSLEWIKGFEWKGLHIRILTHEQAKKVIHEIKALKYALFDYLQLFNTINSDKNNCNNLLSNEIIFPFMSYAYIGGVIIYVSVEIKKLLYDETFLSTNVIRNEVKLERMRKSLLRQNLGLSIKYDNFDYTHDDNDIDNISFDENIVNEEINLSSYSKSDLNNTKILSKIAENNLLKIFEDSNENINERRFKFILINLYSLVPNLFKEDDKTIYSKFNQLNCIDIKNEFETPRFINLTKINNLDKKNELNIINKLIRINATKEEIGIYQNKIDNIDYKIIYYDNAKKRNKINEQVTKYFVQFPLIQNSELSRLLTTEYLNVGNLNKILNKYYTENTQEIPDRNIIIYRTTFQVKMKYSLMTLNKEQSFPKSTEEYISYFKQVCKEMSDNSYKIRNIDNLNDFCERYGLNKQFLPFCITLVEDEYLRNLIQIYLYTSLIKKFYDNHEGQTLLMKLAIFERNKDESIINSSDISKDNNIIEMQKKFIVDIIKLIYLPVESLKDSEVKEPFSKKFFQNISFLIFLRILKLKNFDKYINFKSTLLQLEIKQILSGFNEISRDNPYLFIDSLEKMMNFRMNPFFKYRATIDIKNLKNLSKDDIVIFVPLIRSFVNISSITGYIFTNFAYNTPSSKDNKYKNNPTPILSKIELDNFYSDLMFKNPFNYDKNNKVLLKSNHYYIYNEEIMKKFCFSLEKIYDGIISQNGEKELMLFKSYLYLILTSLIHHNDINEAKDILIKMKENLEYQNYFSFTQYSVLSLLEAIISIDDISFSEKLYSKSLFLSLLNQGDIRSQSSKIHQFLMFPLFQLSKITTFYNNNNYLNEYFNVLYLILDTKISKRIENDINKKRFNLGYYNFPFESKKLNPNEKKINSDYLNDINFKNFICNVIIDYFYSIDSLLYDDDLLLYFKINIKEEKQKKDERILIEKNEEEYNKFNRYISEYLLDEMSYQKFAPSNIVLSFGNNNYKQTAQNNTDNIMVPRIINSLLNKGIIKIFSGCDYNFAIDENNKIYSWGLNSKGQCGIQDKKIIENPLEVNIDELEKDEKIKYITCGNNSTFFVSNKNKIYLCGYNILLEEYYYTPKRIHLSFEKENISQINIGKSFCLFLTNLGNVYNLSEETNQQKNNNDKINEPKQVINIRNIQQISCGYNHCLAIGKNNIIFCWGENSRGQLGINDNNSVNIPIKLVLNDDIDNIFCGKDYTIFHTEKQQILVCGNNEEGQLGLGNDSYSNYKKNKDIIKPTYVDQFYNLEIIKVVCGENNCMAMIRDSTTKMVNIWSWGNNKEGQLGLGKGIENSKPKPIPALLEYINHCPIDISCGKNHCLVLLKRKEEIIIDEKKILNDLISKYNKF